MDKKRELEEENNLLEKWRAEKSNEEVGGGGGANQELESFLFLQNWVELACVPFLNPSSGVIGF